MKTIVFPFIALLLMLAISASPIIPLLDEEMGKMMVLDAAEEEETGNVFSIKKYDEADIYLKYLTESFHQPILQEHTLDYLRYIFHFSDHTIEILDPPPRNFV